MYFCTLSEKYTSLFLSFRAFRSKIYFGRFCLSLEDYSFIILEINLKEQRPWNESPLIISKSWALIKIIKIHKSYPSKSSQSGLFDDVLEVGHDQKCFSGRVTNDTRVESWNLQTGQLQKTIQITPNMSIESLTKFSLTSGEYISIYLIPWIISSTKEKEVPTLQLQVALEYKPDRIFYLKAKKWSLKIG